MPSVSTRPLVSLLIALAAPLLLAIPIYGQCPGPVPEAGAIESQGGRQLEVRCLDDGVSDFVGFRVSGASAPKYAYLITDERGVVEEVNFRGFRNFSFFAPGTSRVYGVAYVTDLRARRGTNIFTDRLSGGCVDLTDGFLAVRRDEVRVGEVSAPGGREFRIDAGDSPVVAFEYSGHDAAGYVVADRAGRAVGFADEPRVDMSCFGPGQYFVYAYAFTGQRTLGLGDSVWGGPAYSDACSERSREAIVVKKSTPIDCPAPCLARAARLVPVGADTFSLAAGTPTLAARPAGPSVLPQGYDSVYVLSRGADSAIVAVRLDAGRFDVSEPGDYAVHLLVAELDDPASPQFVNLATDLSLGATTVAELAARIASTGRCAALSAQPARFFVRDDAPQVCRAFAGGLQPVNANVTLVAGRATLSAAPDGSAVVPAGYEVRYLLTTGFFFTVEQINELPTFTVDSAGDYTVLTLVAELSDPGDRNYVDLGRIDLGVTTAVDFAGAAFAQGLCLDLDFFGAPFRVSGGVCTAEAGTLTAVRDTVALDADGQARLEATRDGNAVVPVNFDRTYILTRADDSLVLGFSARPRFDVIAPGGYRVHEWVGEFTDANAPDFVDILAIPTGQTRLRDLVDLYTGAGLCADLDLAGAAYVVLPGARARTPLDISATADRREVRVTLEADTPADAAAGIAERVTVLLIDNAGRRVRTVVARSVALQGVYPELYALDRRGLPAGLYYVSAVSKQGAATARVVLP